jgi:hypothetical protein
MATIVFPDRAASARHPRAEQVLARAATAARRAPVMGDERPWRWHLAGDSAELYLAGHGTALSLIDCGSALHHALVVLAGEGARALVELFPDPRRRDLLARVRIDTFGPATPAEIRTYRAIALRSTIAAVPGGPAIPAAAKAAMKSAAARAGSHLRLPDRPGAQVALIETELDGPPGWLRQGQARSAVALAAAEHRLAVLPDGGLVVDRRGRAAVPLRFAVPDRQRPVRTPR